MTKLTNEERSEFMKKAHKIAKSLKKDYYKDVPYMEILRYVMVKAYQFMKGDLIRLIDNSDCVTKMKITIEFHCLVKYRYKPFVYGVDFLDKVGERVLVSDTHEYLEFIRKTYNCLPEGFYKDEFKKHEKEMIVFLTEFITDKKNF